MPRILRVVPLAVVVGLLLSPSLPATDASAAPRPAPVGSAGTSAFTAEVASVNHGLRRVSLRGTAPVGTSIELAGDVADTVWTEAGPDGTWAAQVRAGHGEDIRIRVTSAVSGAVIELPVHVKWAVQAPEGITTVDGLDRTITLHMTGGEPRARFELYDDERHVATVRADADGEFTHVFADLAFGSHRLAAWQYYDGEHNGGWDEDLQITGAPVVDSAAVSRDDGVVRLAGRAATGTTLAVTDGSGPVLDADGRPVTVQVGGAGTRQRRPGAGSGVDRSGTAWAVAVPIPEGARSVTYRVTAFDGDVELGSDDATVVVPVALTGTVEQLADGSVHLAGTGEPGGVVALETDDGHPLQDADGSPIATSIGRSWELTVSRDVLPDEVVVARQRVDGFGQGSLHLVLPKLPVAPDPGTGGGSGSGSAGGSGTGAHAGSGSISSGVHAMRKASGGAVRPAARRLASTGTDAGPGVLVGGLLVLSGLGAVVGVHLVQRRAQPTAARRRPRV